MPFIPRLKLPAHTLSGRALSARESDWSQQYSKPEQEEGEGVDDGEVDPFAMFSPKGTIYSDRLARMIRASDRRSTAGKKRAKVIGRGEERSGDIYGERGGGRGVSISARAEIRPPSRQSSRREAGMVVCVRERESEIEREDESELGRRREEGEERAHESRERQRKEEEEEERTRETESSLKQDVVADKEREQTGREEEEEEEDEYFQRREEQVAREKAAMTRARAPFSSQWHHRSCSSCGDMMTMYEKSTPRPPPVIMYRPQAVQSTVEDMPSQREVNNYCYYYHYYHYYH